MLSIRVAAQDAISRQHGLVICTVNHGAGPIQDLPCAMHSARPALNDEQEYLDRQRQFVFDDVDCGMAMRSGLARVH